MKTRNANDKFWEPPRRLIQQAGWWIFFLILICLRPIPAAVPTPPGPGPTWLDWWDFSNTNTWATEYGFAPISFTNLSFSNLGDGIAVVVDSTNAAWLRYNVTESDGTNHLRVDQGSVMFWFAPHWTGTNAGGTGPGQSGRLIEAGLYTTNASYGWWSLYTDPQGANLYFSAQTNNGSQATYLSAPVTWSITNRWHMIALTYSSTNSALYLDGALLTNGTGVTYRPGPNVLTNGFYIGSDSNGVAQARGMFDDLSTYNYPLDSGTIANTFTDFSPVYNLNPMNRANISSAPSSPETAPTFVAITGAGYLQAVSTNTTSCVTSSNIWITNAVATVAGSNSMNLTFAIAGGTNNALYDVFATTALQSPITNGVWYWMGQGYHCVTYTITNLPNTACFLILGQPTDRDSDGLTDAYEMLVSHTDPNKADTSGDGMLDGWKIIWGLNPLINNPAQISERSNFNYTLAGWLNALSGVRTETITPDAEGNLNISQ
jgi:hypothetical protein